jgi:hypothetical protein
MMSRQHTKNEQGMAAIIITIIIMIILTLVVIGFAQITRRQQRQVLDRQLNTQAYYAAETAVNDAATAIASNPNLDLTNPLYKTDCNKFAADAGLNKNVDPSGTNNNVSFSCLLVDSAPNSLEYSDISSNSQVVPLKTNGLQSIDHLRVSWQDKANTANNSQCTTSKSPLPSSAGYLCPYGILRADLVRDDTGLYNIGSLENQLFSAFFLPSTTNNEIPTMASGTGYANGGILQFIKCAGGAYSPTATAPKRCTALINGLGGGKSYMLRLRSIYKSSAVTIIGYDAADNPVSLVGVQAAVDATGKANDVLRRIQVRIPNAKYIYPDFGLQSVTDICKNLVVLPGSITGSGPYATCNPSN